MSGSVDRGQQRTKPVLVADGLSILAAATAFSLDAVLAGMVGAGQGFRAICLYLGLSCTDFDEHLVRLGLSRPHGRPIRTGGRKPWTPEDVTRLIAWRVTGIHPEIIAVRLDRTPGAVRTKARRLGLPRPPRTALRKVDPLSLQDPLPGLGLTISPDPADTPCQVRPASPVSLRQPERKTARVSDGQREMPFFQAVKASSAATAPTSGPVIPRTEAEVDLSGDLTWVGTIRKPQKDRLAVWTIGMLFMGGLYYKEVATRVGKTPASIRTLRTRLGVPVDETRKNVTRQWFDEELANASCAQSGYVVKQCLETRVWFWEHKRNRGCNIAPMVRRKHGIRDTLIEGRSPTFTVLTREDLKSVPPAAFLPFAHRSPTVRAR